jgi:phage-related protein
VGAFLPVIQQAVTVFGQLAEAVGGILTQALEAIKPVLPVIAQAFTDILSAVQPVIAVLGPALGSIFAALAPVIASLAQAFARVHLRSPRWCRLWCPGWLLFTQRWHRYRQVGQILAGVLVTAFQALAPVISALLPVVAAVAQTLGQVLSLGAGPCCASSPRCCR